MDSEDKRNVFHLDIADTASDNKAKAPVIL